jgi:hypothetical protein
MNDLTLTHEVLRDGFAMPQAVEVHRRMKAYRSIRTGEIQTQLWVVDEVHLLDTGERLVWAGPHRWHTEDGDQVFSGDIKDVIG